MNADEGGTLAGIHFYISNDIGVGPSVILTALRAGN